MKIGENALTNCDADKQSNRAIGGRALAKPRKKQARAVDIKKAALVDRFAR